MLTLSESDEDRLPQQVEVETSSTTERKKSSNVRNGNIVYYRKIKTKIVAAYDAATKPWESIYAENDGKYIEANKDGRTRVRLKLNLDHQNTADTSQQNDIEPRKRNIDPQQNNMPILVQDVPNNMPTLVSAEPIQSHRVDSKLQSNNKNGLSDLVGKKKPGMKEVGMRARDQLDDLVDLINVQIETKKERIH